MAGADLLTPSLFEPADDGCWEATQIDKNPQQAKPQLNMKQNGAKPKQSFLSSKPLVKKSRQPSFIFSADALVAFDNMSDSAHTHAEQKPECHLSLKTMFD